MFWCCLISLVHAVPLMWHLSVKHFIDPHRVPVADNDDLRQVGGGGTPDEDIDPVLGSVLEEADIIAKCLRAKGETVQVQGVRAISAILLLRVKPELKQGRAQVTAPPYLHLPTHPPDATLVYKSQEICSEYLLTHAHF